MATATTDDQGRTEVPAQVDVVIVGAGFAGMYLLYLMRQHGINAVALDAASDVGGTWYWNRYPGARCDIESMQYSLQFDKVLEQEWNWSERFAPQPEILKYAGHAADRHDLRRDICFNRRVESAKYDDEVRHWTLTTDRQENITAPFCIMATGCLSVPNKTNFPGEDTFKGPIYHTGNWPHEPVDFTGKRVGVIGTGSSAIQSVPEIAKQAADLTVFQRTANYAVPAHNAPMDPDYMASIKADYDGLRARQSASFSAAYFEYDPNAVAMETSHEDRTAAYERNWQEGGLKFLTAFNDLMVNPEANSTAAEFVRDKIRGIVDDPETAELLCPTNTIGCKRLCVDTGYHKTFNLPHVHLVDVSEAPVSISDTAIITGGTSYEVDAIVYATGFDAMTGALMNIDIKGRGGQQLADKWADGPKSYLGLAMEGFPNLFTVTGPGSPSVFTNMLPAIEQHCDWISDCIAQMHKAGNAAIEADAEAEADWVTHNLDVASVHLRSSCSSWYTGENIAGKPNVFMPYIGGYPRYVDKCNEVAANGYEGFRITAS